MKVIHIFIFFIDVYIYVYTYLKYFATKRSKIDENTFVLCRLKLSNW